MGDSKKELLIQEIMTIDDEQTIRLIYYFVMHNKAKRISYKIKKE